MLSGGTGDDQLSIGFGDSADGGAGSDILRLSLGGAPGGLTLNAATIATAVANTRSGGVYSAYGLTVTNMERLTYLRGSELDDVITSGGGVQVQAGGGNDLIIGSGDYALISGGGGSDRFVRGAAAVFFNGESGSNTVDYQGATEGIRVTLGLASGAIGVVSNGDQLVSVQNIDATTFGDVVVGSDTADVLRGFAGDDRLEGNGGNDSLDGGAGEDEMLGGLGNDRYVIDNVRDLVVELANEGTDLVESSLFVTVLRDNVENLTLSDTADHGAAIGNTANNVIRGNTGRDELFGRAGNDTLYDGGGAADALIGGSGDDVYYVENSGSSTIEAADEGLDEVRTMFSIYGLQSNIENLSATDDGVHVALVGNALANVITGGSGRDDLFGREGNDTLRGGAGAPNAVFGQQGDDIYIVEAVGDSTYENADEGVDTVRTAFAEFVLRVNVEQLVYTGSGRFTGIGNAGGNALFGGSRADFLSGLDGDDVLIGASGADELFGGSGPDQFRYAGGETGFDRIFDFESGSDKIALTRSGFSNTGSFSLVQSAAPAANSGSSTFLYNVNNGMLSYDPDGTGSAAAILLAQLNAGLTLQASDFVLV